MTLQFTVSPDFGPDMLPGWYVVNTLLQRSFGTGVHFEPHPSFAAQRAAIEAGEVDLIYANPADTASLVRDHGFVPLARPLDRPDEALIAVHESAPWHAVEDLPADIRVALTEDPDVTMIGMIMLEPADIDRSTITLCQRDSYVLVAKALLDQSADVGLFLIHAFEGLSGLVRRQLRPLVSSGIDVIHHGFLAGPRLAAEGEELTGRLVELSTSPSGARAFEELGIGPLVAMSDEEAEFMIDLMDTLVV